MKMIKKQPHKSMEGLSEMSRKVNLTQKRLLLLLLIAIKKCTDRLMIHFSSSLQSLTQKLAISLHESHSKEALFSLLL